MGLFRGGFVRLNFARFKGTKAKQKVTTGVDIKRPKCPPPNKKTLDHDDTFEQKAVRVSVLGAGSTTGQALCLLLKQNPLVSHIYMYDCASPGDYADDLRKIDTRAGITSHNEKEIIPAIRTADIVVILGLDKYNAEADVKDQLTSEGTRIVHLAKMCTSFAPNAILIDCVAPVSVTLPLISEMYRRNHWYHPGRVVGSVSLLQIQLNTLLARYEELNPTSVNVPLVGGPELDTIVPLFSRASPTGLPMAESRMLINRFKNLSDDASPTARVKFRNEYCPYSSAFAIARMVTTVGLGLMGDASALCTAFVRSNILNTCRHLVCTVKFGKIGIEHNYGIPQLTSFELKMLERATIELSKREKFAMDYLKVVESKLAPSNQKEADLREKLYLATTDRDPTFGSKRKLKKKQKRD